MNVGFRKPSTKSQMLEDAGYQYSFDRRLYVNRQKKSAFSLKFLENHSDAEIAQCIQKNGAGEDEWHFFFDEAPTDIVRRQLANLLDG